MARESAMGFARAVRPGLRRAGPMLLALQLLAAPAAGQEAPAGPAPTDQLRASDLSPEAARDLVARLSDAEVRALLLERLDAVATPRPDEPEIDPALLVRQLQDEAGDVRTRFQAMLGAIDELPGVVPLALAHLLDGRSPWLLLWIGLGFALMLGAGWLAERLFNIATRGLRERILVATPETLAGTLAYLALRLLLDMAALGVFLATAIGAFLLMYQGHEMTRTTVVTYIAAIGVVRAFSLISRFLLAPRTPALRLAHIPDDAARFLHRQNVVITSIAAYGFFSSSLLAMMGATGDVHRLISMLVGIALIGTIAYTIWRARAAISADIRGDGDVWRARQIFADLWPGIIIAFVVALYVIVVLVNLSGGQVSYLASFGTLLTAIFLPHIDAAIEGEARRQEKTEPERGQLQAVVLRSLRIALIFAAVLFIARIWGLDLFSFAQESMGTRFAGALIDIGLTALVGYVLWQITRIAIDRRIAAESGPAQLAEAGDEGAGGGSRLGTLLPLIRRVIQVAIAVIAIMTVLAALGVNIGPLLAGAGVVGLAVGFGAQTLVRDIVSGVFFLVDDAFRVGEYIDVGAAKGTVEKISVRSLRLRHHRGALHTVPFGEITTLTNYSRDWVIMKLEFRVPFDTDIEQVRKIFKQIGKELAADPELGADFIAPFKSQGVYSVDDSALVIRAKFTARPGRQFLIRREAYAAVQREFARHDIRFADRRVTVHVPEAEDMPPEKREAVERAAASAIAHQKDEAAVE
jgi:small-conductance mechanosensitive channel